MSKSLKEKKCAQRHMLVGQVRANTASLDVYLTPKPCAYYGEKIQ